MIEDSDFYKKISILWLQEFMIQWYKSRSVHVFL